MIFNVTPIICIYNLLLCHRVSDSDDLSMSESEVGKLSVSIEKEMFNLYLNTDNKYKNKYRSLMFNLKDPKNKVCHFFCGLIETIMFFVIYICILVAL